MSGHLRLTKSNDNKTLDKLYSGVLYDMERNYSGLRGSLKYMELPQDYREEDDTNVFTKQVSVPSSLVIGGRAALEVHVNGKELNSVYLVA